jgi:dihydroneopterin aldolase
MQIIEVNNIRLHANHGCMEEEYLIGGEYVVNVHLWVDFSEAGQTDKLKKTIDYVQVNEIVESQMKIRSKLIEHVGWRIMEKLKTQFPQCDKIRVKVVKLAPPINGNVDNVAIIIEG